MSGFARLVEGGVALGVPLLHALLANLEDVGAGLAELGAVLGSTLFGLGDGFLRVFDGAGGQGAAFLEGFRQRPLDEELVSQDQQDEEQGGRNASDQKSPDLLEYLFHVRGDWLRRTDGF